jgi:hypothetical protein
MSYRQRFGLFLLFISLVTCVDFVRHRRRAGKWREYSFLLLGGSCGALFGVINDYFITSQISSTSIRANRNFRCFHSAF